MKNIITELHIIIKNNFDILFNNDVPIIYNLIYLSNYNTLDYIYGLKPNENIITICHRLQKDLLIKILNSLETKYDLKYLSQLDTKYNLKFDKLLKNNINNYKLIEFEISFEDVAYKFILKHENKIEKTYPIHNLYLDLYDLQIYNNENENNTLVRDIDDFIEKKLLNENFIQKVITDDNFIILHLIVGFIKYKNIIFKNLLDKFKTFIAENKKFRKKMKHFLELGNNERNIRIFKFFEINSDIISDFNIFVEKEFNIINKVLYGIDSFCSYNIEVKTIEDYLVLIILNKLEIVDTNYVVYAKRYIKKNLNDISDVSENIENPNDDCLEDENEDDLMNDLIVDKVDDFRHIKKEANSKEIEKYLNGLDNRKVFYIKNCISLMSILFYSSPNTKYNIEMIKLGYIIKKFSYLKEIFMNKNIDNYNKIILYLKLKNTISKDNNFYKLCFSNKLLFYEIKKMTEIPLIIKKYNNDEDIIDIEDFQENFVFLYDFLLKNKINIDDIEESDLDLYFESQMSNFRSNKIIKVNNKRKRSYTISNDEDNDFFNWIGLSSKEINVISSVLSNKDEETIEDYLIDSSKNLNEIDMDDMDDMDDIDGMDDTDDMDDMNDMNDMRDMDGLNDIDGMKNDDEVNINLDINDLNYNSKNIKNMMYKLKYDRYKMSYLKLKLVDKLLDSPEFEIELLDGYNKIDEELMDKLLTKYSLKINFDDETSESEN